MVIVKERTIMGIRTLYNGLCDEGHNKVAMTESSAILTRYSTKSEPSVPGYVAHFARKRSQSSVGS